MWSRVRTAASSRIFIYFTWTYSCLLMATFALKFTYLREVRKDEFGEIWHAAVYGGGGLPALERLFLSFRSDILEVLVFTAFLFVLGRMILRLPLGVLSVSSVLLCMLIGGGNVIVVRQVGKALTIDTLWISLNWISHHPELITEFVTPRMITFLAAALPWSFIPLVMSTRRKHLLPRLARPVLQLALLISVLAALLAPGQVIPRSLLSLSPLQKGYWTSATIGFVKMRRTSPLDLEVPTLASLREAYRELAYPGGGAARMGSVWEIPAERMRPRHVVVVTLETAPRKYYPIVDNPEFPAFYRMSQRAIVSDRHYATSPYTTAAIL